ncbi:MAG: LUD domain-containing protein [Pseudomonadota bacterium]
MRPLARDRILERIRRGTGHRTDPRAVGLRLEARAQTAPVPALGTTAGRERTDQFMAKVQGVDATITRLPDAAALPQALAEELRARNLPATIRTGADPLFEQDWGGLERSVGIGRLREPATLSRAHLASAETGTLLLASGPDNPVTLTFLGETHFVAVHESTICAGFEEMWARWREMGRDPRTVNLVTGPSRSADIGQKLQLGAHGPVALHVFLIAG